MTNAKSLLDAPSEYYIDRRTHMLYFIPPNGSSVSDPSGQGAFLSRAQTSHTMNGTSSVVLRGLRMEYAMGAALVAINISDVQIDNCTISNSGTDGIRFEGRNSTLSGCDVYDVGCNAIVMSGGDIPSLTPGNLLIFNNTLHRFARVSRTVRVGVSWTGCGNTVSHNEVFDAPQIGMIGHGASRQGHCRHGGLLCWAYVGRPREHCQMEQVQTFLSSGENGSIDVSKRHVRTTDFVLFRCAFSPLTLCALHLHCSAHRSYLDDMEAGAVKPRPTGHKIFGCTNPAALWFRLADRG